MVIKSILEKANISIVLISLLVLSITCSEVPNDSFNNPNDPEAESYVTDPVIVLVSSLTENLGVQSIQLSWSIAPDKIEGTTGFEVYRSFSDTSNFEYFDTILNSETVSTSGIPSFSLSHPVINGVFNYLFRVRSFYVSISDTVFSEPVTTELSIILPVYESSIQLKPFNKPPVYEVYIRGELENASKIRLLKLNLDGTIEEVAELPVKNGYVSATAPLDVNEEEHLLRYQFLSSKYESGYYNFFPTYVDLHSNLQAIFSIENENSLSIEFDYYNQDSLDSYPKANAFFEHINAELFKINDEDSTSLVQRQLQPGESITYDNVNTEDTYLVKYYMKNGRFQSYKEFRSLSYQFEEDSRSSGNLNISGFFNNMSTEFHPSEDLLFIGSSTGSTPIILNYSTGQNISIPFVRDERIAIHSEFIFNTTTNNYDLLVVGNDNVIYRWELVNNSINSVSNYTTTTGNLIDIDSYDNNKVVLLSHSPSTQSGFVSIFDPAENKITGQRSISCFNRYSSRIFHDHIYDKIYVAFSNGCKNLITINQYDAYTLEELNTLDVPIYRDTFLAEIGNDFNTLIINSVEDFYVINLTSFSIDYTQNIRYPLDYRSVNISASDKNICTAIRDDDGVSPSSYISCFSLQSGNLAYYFGNNDTGRTLLKSTFDPTGSKLILIYRSDYEVINFKKVWQSL